MADCQVSPTLLSRNSNLNILHDSSPSYLRDLFIRSTLSIRPSRQLSFDVFAVPNFCTSTFRNSFYLSVIYFWQFPPPPRPPSLLAHRRDTQGSSFWVLFDLDNDPAWCSGVSLGLSAGLSRPGPFLVLLYSVAAIARRLLRIPAIALFCDLLNFYSCIIFHHHCYQYCIIFLVLFSFLCYSMYILYFIFFAAVFYFAIIFSVSVSCILFLAIRFHHGLINLINQSLVELI